MLKSHILCVLFTVCGLSFALATLSGEVAEILRRGGRFFPCMWQVQPGICTFYSKFCRDLRSDQQRNDGKVAIYLPNELPGLSAAVWSDIATFLPKMLHTY